MSDTSYTLEITRVGWFRLRATVWKDGELVMCKDGYSRDYLERDGAAIISLLKAGHAPEELLSSLHAMAEPYDY